MYKMLNIDLSNRVAAVEDLPQKTLESYLGGRGLGARLLYDYLEANVDPLSPENVIILSVGPAQGINTPYSSREVMHTKSPLTGIYLYSVASGRIGHNLRKAGYYSLVIKGKAESPVYLYVNDNKVEFRTAEHLWGLNTFDSYKSMIDEVGDNKASCLNIGQAGEQLILTSCVMTEGDKSRTFGRGGLGAVFGSKKLKGLVVMGSQNITPVDFENYDLTRKEIIQKVRKEKDWAKNWQRFGTGSDILMLNATGILPTKNWQSGVFEKVKGIALTEIEGLWPRDNTDCGPYCITPCAHKASIKYGEYKGSWCRGPEYETIYSFGSNCGVEKFDAIVAAAQICDSYGIDTMSTGVSIGFAMECYESGLITKKDTDGLELKFGNDKAMVKMVKKMATNEGFGALLNQGVYRASLKIPGSTSFAMHVKGLELGGYECRSAWGQALQVAISSRGGCHHGYGLPARYEVSKGQGCQLEGKAELVKKLAIQRIIFDSSVLCTFPQDKIGLELLGKILTYITGLDFGISSIQEIGFRILTLERLFNVREGITRINDKLPERLTNEPTPAGPCKGSVVKLDALLDDGYKALGWNDNGIPTEETVSKLGLNQLRSI